ncbi:MAG: 3'-5' exonuclease [Evtepia sp.]|uniref:ATP-dependent helicase n=1 Tax=Evtepia sp. TaxID=2773933 RepID=UPI002A75985D|nr:UvrD-helicase domain-containing protein [Evtepia sp.]MDY3013635.1 3'-5' exonuclease [Evtepia sp.]
MLSQEKQLQFAALRRKIIAREFGRLNPRQLEGVLTTEGPLLLLAGAGSGKTTVLIHRIANLLRYGRGSDSQEVPDYVSEEDLAFLEGYFHTPSPTQQEKSRARLLCAMEPAMPWQVIAITFTNKAAGELKQRLEAEIGPEAQDIWAATFHSACVRILRRDIEKLGFPSSFTIYDTDDSIRVIKECLKELNLDDKTFPPRSILGYISRAKDDMLLAPDYMEQCKAKDDFRLQKIANVYLSYQKKLWAAGALDFDDIILHTVRLLQQEEEVRAYYQRKFRYVLIDEYQDTNHLQYLLAGLLAGGRKNICVVGDDDQSIYRFRGATIENILSFESEYQNARVIRLEQNYRSTGNILEAANAVIRNNRGRKGKNLWTDHGDGEKVQCYTAANEREEGMYIASQLLRAYGEGKQWKDCAVLYRMNALSNQVEMALKSNSIPYRVVGGFRFFERAEIKDMLSYLCVIHNPDDDLRLLRVVNNPPRGIGAKTLETAREIAVQEDLSLWEVLVQAERWKPLEKSVAKFRKFTDLIQAMQKLSQEAPLPVFYETLLQESGYADMLTAKKDNESKSRLENVHELSSSISGYLEHAEEPSLGGFLDEVALYTDLDSVEDTDNCVTLMTMHAAKGLEFPVVFTVGMEEGVFPGFRSIGEEEELEEERRLCYVALTRAKEKLYLTCAAQRMLFGRTSANLPSRFVKEIPEELVQFGGRPLRPRRDPFLDEPWGAEETSFSQIQKPARPAATARPTTRAAYRTPAPKAQPLPELKKGDMVRHTAFGNGMVLSVQKMGGDALLEVAFDNIGTKRMMLKAASQFMQKL